jgi:hypothetical protein
MDFSLAFRSAFDTISKMPGRTINSSLARYSHLLLVYPVKEYMASITDAFAEDNFDCGAVNTLRSVWLS